MSRKLNTTGGANTHRFQSEQERIKSLNFKVGQKLFHANHAYAADNLLSTAPAASALFGSAGDEDATMADLENTYFRETLMRWREKNATALFASMARAVHPLCYNLTLISVNRSKIVDIIIAHLQVPSSDSHKQQQTQQQQQQQPRQKQHKSDGDNGGDTNDDNDAMDIDSTEDGNETVIDVPTITLTAFIQGLEPILGLIVALAQDLESDLADDYQRLFNAVCPLVKLSDSSVVALAFDCLGSLTKSLGSALVSNMDSTLSLFAPLLGAQNQRSHIRKFAAQTLALLVRRARDGKLKEFVEAMYNLLHQTSAESAVVVKNRRSFAEGCAMLIYEAIKGVEGQLHSRAGVIYSSVLDKFITNNNNNNNNNDDDDSDSDDNEIYGHSTRLVIIVTNLILHHVDREHSSPIYTAILDAFSKTIDSAPQNMRTLTRLISLLRTSVALREGRRVPDLAPVVQSALSLYNNDTINSSNGDGVNNGSNQPPSVTASLWTEFMRQRTGLAVSTLHKCTLEQLLKSGRLLLETLAEREDPACFIALGLSLLRLKWQYSAQFLLPLLARVSDSALSSSSPAAASNTGDKLLVFWAHVIESGVVSPSALTHGGSKSSEMFVSSTVGADGLIRFPGPAASSSSTASSKSSKSKRKSTGQKQQQQQQESSSSDAVSGGFISHLLSVLSAPVEWSSDNSSAFSTDVDSTQRSLSPIERLSLALICVRGVFVGPRSSAFIDSLQTLLTQLQQQQQQQQQSDAVPVSVIGQTISTLIDVIQRSGSKTTSILAELWKSTVSKLIIAHPNCPSIVSASATLAGLLRPTFGSSGDEDVAELFSSKAVVAILPILVPNISSVDASLRLATLELLSHYDQLPLKSSEPGSNQEEKKSAKKSKSAIAVTIKDDSASTVSLANHIIEYALTAERTQATITTYRDKLMALRSLSTLAAARRIPGEYIEILPRLCIAFFSINMQPIWQESIAALKVVAESHPKVVWRLIHRELLRYEPADASSSGTVQPLMISAAVRNWMHDELDAFHRETVPKPSPFLDGLVVDCKFALRTSRIIESSLRRLDGGLAPISTVDGDSDDEDNVDINAGDDEALSLAGHARLLFIARHTLSGSLLDADYSASLAQVNLRLDYATIYEQLMRAMIECPHVAEQNASALVPLLFDFTDPARVHDQSRGFVPVAFVHRQAPSDPDVRTLPAPKRLTLALTLMGKFKSPTQGACAAHSQQLYEYYMELLTKPDSRIQLLALECILTWKDKSITTYAEHLRALLDEKRFRDELTTFVVDATSSADKSDTDAYNIKPSASIEEAEAPTVHSEHRSGLMSVMLRLLYGRSIGKAGNVGAGSSGRKTRRSGASISGVRRIAILAKLSNLPADELRVFVDIMLAPFRHLRDNLSAEDGHELVVRKMADGDMPSARHQLGFFNYLADLIKQFGKHSQPFMGELLNVLLSLHVGAQKVLDETMDVDSADNDDDVEEEDDNDEVDDEKPESGEAATSEDAGNDNNEEEQEEDENEEDVEAPLTASSALSMSLAQAKQVRQLIVRQICALFRIPVSYNFRDLLPRIFEVAISPRLARFSVENTQAPSALMELFAVWSARPAYLSFLHEFDSRILSGIVGCLSAPQLRHTVAIEAVAITENIVNHGNPDADLMLQTVDADTGDRLMADAAPVCDTILKTNISPILSGFDALLRRIPAMFASAVSNTLKAHTLQHMADQLLRRTIRILSAIAEHVTDASLAHRLLALLLPLTRKPTRTVPEQTKAHILEIFTGFVPLLMSLGSSKQSQQQQQQQQQQPVLSAGSALFTEYYGIISRLFAQLASAPARQALVNSLTALVQVDSASIKHVAHLVSELNSYSVARISEPDYDRRLKMFSVIIDSEWQTLSPIEWLPLLHNFVFFMSDSDEMALQRVASASMNRFAERVAHTTSAQPSGDDVVKQLVDLLMNLVIAAIEHAAKNRTSTVRSEFVQLYGYIVKTCPHVDARIAELVPLLGSDPSNNTVISETSFFSNILHLQIHRRSRAMRRFRDLLLKSLSASTLASSGSSSTDGNSNVTAKGMNMMLSIRSKSILNFFIPLLTHFVFETLDDVSGAKQDPANEAVATIGVLCRSVPWARYLSTLRGFIKMVDKKPELERLMVKLVISILDNFSFDVTSATTGTAASIAEDATEDAENDGDDDTNEVERAVASAASAANIAADSGVAQAERIVNTIISVIVPDLKKILSSGLNTINNDDTTIAVRIPIGFSLVKLLRALTTETLRLQLPGVLTLLCNILRSRRIDVRSATRDTLVKIAKHLGPAYVQFIVKEMQSALTQGYQLHVLGYSAYTLLVSIIDTKNTNKGSGSTADSADTNDNEAMDEVDDEEEEDEDAVDGEREATPVTAATAAATATAGLTATVEHMCHTGDLDYCLPDLVELFIQDIFGAIGSEKESTDWVGKMKESKAKKGYDAFGLLARVTPVPSLGTLLLPLREILTETESPKTTKKVDKVLSQVQYGVMAAADFTNAGTMSLCKDILVQSVRISQNTGKKQSAAANSLAKSRLEAARRANDAKHTVMMKRSDVLGRQDYFPQNAYRFTAFALGLLQMSLKQNRLVRSDESHIALVDPVVAEVAEALYLPHQNLVASAISIFTMLCRWPLPAIARAIPGLLHRVLQHLRAFSGTSGSGSSATGTDMSERGELVQSCVALLNTILRNSDLQVDVSSSQLEFLINLARVNLEEPERQFTMFALVKSILTRRFMSEQLYDLMTSISQLMITSQDVGVRSTCRQLYFQFLMDYPQSEQRLKNQILFVVKQLEYVHESGRQSAMEMLHLIITKFSEDVLAQFVDLVFMGLVLSLINDESKKCREMTATLIKLLVSKMQSAKLEATFTMLEAWFDSPSVTAATNPNDNDNGDEADEADEDGEQQKSNNKKNQQKQKQKQKSKQQKKPAATVSPAAMKKKLTMRRAAMQIYGLVVESLGDQFRRQVPALLERIHSALRISYDDWKDAEQRKLAQLSQPTTAVAFFADSGPVASTDDVDVSDWELGYFALQTFGKLINQFGDLTLTSSDSNGAYTAQRELAGLVWRLVIEMLPHPYEWVRLSTCRLLGILFAKHNSDVVGNQLAEAFAEQIDEESDAEYEEVASMDQPLQKLDLTMLSYISSKLYVQLGGRIVSDELGTQLVRNLLFIGKCMLPVSLAKLAVSQEDAEEDGDNDNNSDGEAESGAEDENQEDQEDQEDDAQAAGSSKAIAPLVRLYRQVASVARTELIRSKSNNKRIHCFRWFAAMTLAIPTSAAAAAAASGNEDSAESDDSLAINDSLLDAILPVLIDPIYRTLHSVSDISTSAVEELKQLAQEVSDIIQQHSGATHFFNAYNLVRKRIEDTKNERRAKRKFMAMVDSEQAARRKIQKNEMKRKQKKNARFDQSRKRFSTTSSAEREKKKFRK